MITNSTVHELLRIVQTEAGSAMPNAPVRDDGFRGPRLPAVRRRLTRSLRRMADAIEPDYTESAR